MESKKKRYKGTYRIERDSETFSLTEREPTYGCRGSGWGEGIVRELWMDVYTLLYLKWITHRMYCVAHGTLLNVMWQPAWKGIWGRRDTRTCMAESLCCSPETITTLLIGCTPKQTNKKSLQRVFDHHPNTTIFFRCILSNTGFSRLGWGFDQRWFL